MKLQLLKYLKLIFFLNMLPQEAQQVELLLCISRSTSDLLFNPRQIIFCLSA